ncbi:hypothetical protein ACIOG7_02875 [Streptomyces sp. NPDC087894]|uniref:hypothetical protein n=1 Tax=Streptomyces sp. NPDC087894 TaxID=3365816 RepID=UPI0038131A1C
MLLLRRPQACSADVLAAMTGVRDTAPPMLPMKGERALSSGAGRTFEYTLAASTPLCR